ncbi:MAG: hypothetical protein OEY99_00070 [Aigarchaeota archaeon]|nr:hypothetical protein [Aigarchaeota archaeon]MDH5702596.1 hypothetical protein [Aigarchaeota archaeon]
MDRSMETNPSILDMVVRLVIGIVLLIAIFVVITSLTRSIDHEDLEKINLTLYHRLQSIAPPRNPHLVGGRPLAWVVGEERGETLAVGDREVRASQPYVLGTRPVLP